MITIKFNAGRWPGEITVRVGDDVFTLQSCGDRITLYQGLIHHGEKVAAFINDVPLTKELTVNLGAAEDVPIVECAGGRQQCQSSRME